MKPLTDFNGMSNTDMFGNPVELDRSPLASRFIVSPFSVFDVKVENWTRRKREWIRTLGIKGEEGRDSVAELSGSAALAEGQSRLDAFRDKIGPNSKVNNICSEKWGRGQATEVVPGGGGPNAVRRKAAGQVGKCFDSGAPGELNKNLKRGDNTGAAGQHGTLGISDSAMRIAGGYHEGDGKAKSTAGTSIFDPVLCEIGYRWFAPPNGRILDPFAGGSTRGLVAAFLGYSYTGIEIRPDQIAANERQALALSEKYRQWNPEGQEWNPPQWIEGSSENLTDLTVFEEPYDLIFSCPPYYNLEIYSSDSGDGSSFPSYEAFMVWYENIYRQAVARLKHNRFVFITVGDVRDDKSPLGEYLNFEADTIAMFRRLGLYFYNRAVLSTAIGSLPVRIGEQFAGRREQDPVTKETKDHGGFRKLGNTHQMCYVFWKGDRDRVAIKEALGLLAPKDFGG